MLLNATTRNEKPDDAEKRRGGQYWWLPEKETEGEDDAVRSS